MFYFLLMLQVRHGQPVTLLHCVAHSGMPTDNLHKGERAVVVMECISFLVLL